MKHRWRLIVVIVLTIACGFTLKLFTDLSALRAHDDNETAQKRVGLRVENEMTLHLIKKPVDNTKLPALSPNIREEQAKQQTQDVEQEFKDTMMFDDSIERLLKRLEADRLFGFQRDKLQQEDFEQMVLGLGRKAQISSQSLPWESTSIDDNVPNYKKFHFGIRAAALYDPLNPAIEGLLHDLATLPFKTLNMMDIGTELKLLIKLKDGGKAVFKPMRWSRDVETLPNHYYFNDYERHNAEIAGFHLDRILGFYRVPPVSGRIVNMTSELYELGEHAFRTTFYISPIGNLCFFGDCTYYCDSRHSFCGEIDMIEGSMMVYLPEGSVGRRERWKSPYRRSYSKFKKADWEMDDQYCKENLLSYSPYLYDRFLLDLIDAHIFDFITGNMDRHHIEVFEELYNKSAPILFDNGRGFGKKKVDDFSIIAPLHQCCKIRKSTFQKLIKLYIGPERLSVLLDTSLKSDPLYPVLAREYYTAVDRRLIYILRIVAKCIDRHKSIRNVIQYDGF